MATATEAPDSLQTEAVDDGDSSEAFAKIAEQLVPQEAPTEPEGAEGDETTDLSHPKEEPEPTAEEPEEPAAEETPPKAEDNDELPADLKERIDKRIGKEVAKRKALEERAEALEAELAELKSKTEKPSEAEPDKPKEPPSDSIPDVHLNQIPELQKIAQDIGKVEETHRQSVDFLRRLRRGEGDKVVAELRGIFEKSPGMLHRISDEDSARDFLEEVQHNTGNEWHRLTVRQESTRERYKAKLEQDRAVSLKETETIYPWLKDKAAPEQKIAQNYRKQFPGLEHLPNGWRLIARLVKGEMAEQAAAQDKPSAPPPKPPKVPIAPKPAAPTSQKPKVDASALELKAIETGSDEDVARAIEAKMAKLF